MRRLAGYTLIELLVALAVVGLLSLMLLTGLSRGNRTWIRMDHAATRVEGVEAAQALLRARLQHAWPATLYNMQPPGPDFDGEATRLIFLAPPAARDGPGALRRFRLELEPSGDLVLASVSDVALTPRGPETRDVLLRGVQAISLNYFGAIEPDPTPHWRERWSQRPRMPSLVRVRLRFGAGDRRLWPDLIVHPLADMDTECVLVPATGGCKAR
uniref:General secretion pathway protein J n=1 Tax=Caulobacter sp. (strain K31) TaxID=366602 RepID=B0T7N4_CAUSK